MINGLGLLQTCAGRFPASRSVPHGAHTDGYPSSQDYKEAPQSITTALECQRGRRRRRETIITCDGAGGGDYGCKEPVIRHLSCRRSTATAGRRCLHSRGQEHRRRRVRVGAHIGLQRFTMGDDEDSATATWTTWKAISTSAVHEHVDYHRSHGHHQTSLDGVRLYAARGNATGPCCLRRNIYGSTWGYDACSHSIIRGSPAPRRGQRRVQGVSTSAPDESFDISTAASPGVPAGPRTESFRCGQFSLAPGLPGTTGLIPKVLYMEGLAGLRRREWPGRTACWRLTHTLFTVRRRVVSSDTRRSAPNSATRMTS
jgi:hypothetical protein